MDKEEKELIKLKKEYRLVFGFNFIGANLGKHTVADEIKIIKDCILNKTPHDETYSIFSNY